MTKNIQQMTTHILYCNILNTSHTYESHFQVTEDTTKANISIC